MMGLYMKTSDFCDIFLFQKRKLDCKNIAFHTLISEHCTDLIFYIENNTVYILYILLYKLKNSAMAEITPLLVYIPIVRFT